MACSGDNVGKDVDVSQELLSKRTRHLSVALVETMENRMLGIIISVPPTL